LFSHAGVAVGQILRSEASDDAVQEALIRAVWEKPEGNEFSRGKMRGVPLEKTLAELVATRDLNPSIRSIGG
jgi:molybdenum cofactor biosynthesis enzyme MoaA